MTLTEDETGELLGMSGRHFRRLAERYDEDGQERLRDRRLGKASPLRAPASELARMKQLYEELYGDFTIKHFHEQLQTRDGYRLSYTVTPLALQAAGLARKTKRGGPTARSASSGLCRASCCSRTARPIAGSPRSIAIFDLIVTLDDTTGAIYSALAVAEEGTASSFLGLAETIAAKDLAMRMPTEAWKTVEWREGSNQTLSSRFAALRVRPASRDSKLIEPHPVEWLVVEWPEGEGEPTKYWLSTLPEDTPLTVLRQGHQAALAHRTRLRGIEERARPRSLREATLRGFIITPVSASQPTGS
jgi:hypothetical protein